MTKTQLAFAWGVCCCLIAGCGGPAVIYLKGVKPLNVNDRDESTPVDVRVYFLRDGAKFLRAPFEELWVNEKETLGEDWIAEPRVYTVFPKEEGEAPQEVVLGTLDGEVRFIGVLALYGKKGEEGTSRQLALPTSVANGSIFEFRGYEVKKQ